MKKVLMTTLLMSLTYGDTYKDEDPANITNLEELKKLDSLAYNLADNLADEEHIKKIETKKIFDFILKHKSYILGYSLLKVTAQGQIGRRTKRATDETDDETGGDINSMGFPDDFNYYRVGVAVSYPLYDEKTSKKINNDMVEYKAKLLDIIKEYQTVIAESINLKEKLEYYRLLQLRAKARQKTGQIYLDERLKVIEKILEINENIRTKEIEASNMKMILLNYVKDEYQSELEKML